MSGPKGGLRKIRKAGTYIPRDLLRDQRLSYMARGILAYLLDHPEEWNARSKAIAADSDRDGVDKVQTALKELRVHGYLRLERRQGSDGRFFMGTAISETPVAEWIADSAEYGGREVPVVWKDGRYWVRHKDGTLTADPFDDSDEDRYEPPGPGLRDEPSEDDPDRETPIEPAFPQVTPEPGFPVPVSPGPVQPVPGKPGSGSAGTGKPATIRSKEQEEPTRSFRRSESPPEPQNGAPRGAGGNGKPKKTRPAAKREQPQSPEQQELDDTATRITREWLAHWRSRKVPIINADRVFGGVRNSYVLPALIDGATETQIKTALAACNDPFPPDWVFQRAIIEAVQGVSQQAPGRPQPGPSRSAPKSYRQQDMPEAERTRLNGIFSQPSVNGDRPSVNSEEISNG